MYGKTYASHKRYIRFIHQCRNCSASVDVGFQKASGREIVINYFNHNFDSPYILDNIPNSFRNFCIFGINKILTLLLLDGSRKILTTKRHLTRYHDIK